ncbi:MAG: cysteine-rich CWC family protein [Verrucomicrobiae bacterium]|nr:cysteine-rich CWC family protein [Verrucomicrobiae bacterium]
MSCNHSVDPSRCPICGQPNHCRLAKEEPGSAPCWCASQKIGDAVLRHIPSFALRRVCVCRSCVEKFSETERPAAIDGFCFHSAEKPQWLPGLSSMVGAILLAIGMAGQPVLAQSVATNLVEKAEMAKKEESTRQKHIMDEVVVTATRTSKNTDETPSRTTVVDREKMETMPMTTLDDALKNESGLFVERHKGLADSAARVQARGMVGQNRTLILLDGMPLNNGYSGGVQWNVLGMENVGQVEVARGAGSSLYGGSAMGGVVNIIPQMPEKLEFGAKTGFGSDNTLRYSGYVGDVIKEKFRFRLGYEAESTDGYPSMPASLSTARPTAGAGVLSGGYPSQSSSGASNWIVGDKGDNYASRWNGNLLADYKVSETGRLSLQYQMGHYEYGYGDPHAYLTDRSGNSAEAGRVTVDRNRYVTASISTFNSSATDYFWNQYNSGLKYEDQFGDLQFTGKAGFQLFEQVYATSSATGAQGWGDAPGSQTDSTGRS